MDILILGGAGQVGTELQVPALWDETVRLHAPSRTELDITDGAAIDAALAERPYAAVVNTAAYTAVDKAESEIAAAWALNAVAPALLATATAKAGIPLVHVSTDYVFDGDGVGACTPETPVNPRSVYGASKAAGEMAVRAANPRHAIIRTAWVVSPHRGNFVKTMLRLSAERDRLSVVDDQHGNPTSAGDLAAGLAVIAQALARDPGAPTGTHHFVNAGATTWCGFARGIIAAAARRGGRDIPVEAIPTSAFPTPARRPANSQLSTQSLREAYGLTPRPWPEALEAILDRLIGPEQTAKETRA